MLAANLENWFARVKRPMPWRRRPSPYVCWISEIMMQQTTYAAVLPYYERFLKKFPTVEKLAAAQEGEVLKAWEGLGYYARARNRLRAARQIVSAAGTAPPRDRACSRGGLSTSEAAAKRSLEWCVSPAQGVRGDIRWPSTSAEWSQIPGVGPYTAAALSSVLEAARPCETCGAAPAGNRQVPRSGRLQPGDDGARGARLHTEESRLQTLSACKDVRGKEGRLVG